jgi:hypothetical protein
VKIVTPSVHTKQWWIFRTEYLENVLIESFNMAEAFVLFSQQHPMTRIYGSRRAEPGDVIAAFGCVYANQAAIVSARMVPFT